jgi:hypothetical protein
MQAASFTLLYFMKKYLFLTPLLFLLLAKCSKKNDEQPAATNFSLLSASVDNASVNNGVVAGYTNLKPSLRFTFDAALNGATAKSSCTFKDAANNDVPFSATVSGTSLVISPDNVLSEFKKYVVVINNTLTAVNNGRLRDAVSVTFSTGIDSTDKFPPLSDEDLLTKVQQQTFKYFWDFGHPVSGLARERNTSGDVVTSGGSGFGIMAILTGINRNFISRAQGLTRLQTMVSFLKNTVQKYHGAFPHWLNGATGATMPFSTKDNGADLVETAFLMEGLLCARQYFNGSTAAETTLRSDINTLYNNVEWDWFRKSAENVLYWHWSPNYGWDMNMPIKGYNECLIAYVLAAASPTHTIPKLVYDNGWAGNGSMKNNAVSYNLLLPLGPSLGGPLFFEHYSYMGINPNNLQDAYANYQQQVTNHTRINYEYCKANPQAYYGYSSQCWGLTASDQPNNGYDACSPTNDKGTIAPTAALSSFPYTPVESMAALKFFYYKLGDKLFKEYGFTDAFNLKENWFATSTLAIDQGPIICMIENYRSGLLWNLFTSCPEVKAGMTKLGFTAPYL